MTPKARRERLFKKDKPHIRSLTEGDMKWLYAAYKYPNPPEDDFQPFVEDITQRLSGYDLVFIAEDRNNKFKDKWGPVGLIAALFNGWTLDPHVQWFPWATKANKVRVPVSFFMFCRYNSEFGCTEVRTLEKDFFKHLKKYCPIYYVNKIPGGDPRGDLHLFYVRGKKSGKTLWAS